jgi:predicted  nucleic acid-binding Zn-ribbon protein
VDNAVRDLRIEVDDLTAEQKRADADVEQVKTRRVRDQGMIDAGQVKEPKALERMLGELESLHRRITSLEDTELEVMERLEAAQLEHERLDERLAAIDVRAGELLASRAAAAGDVTAEVDKITQERTVTAGDVPGDLLALYEKIRTQKGGVGAAALRARRCSGCSLELTASDLGSIAKAPSDEVLRCEECNRILVRTSESGV